MADEVQQLPEVYADGVSFGIGPFTVILAFTVQPAAQAGPSAPARVVNVRMSPEHAKVMAILLRKQLKTFEEDMGDTIPLHPKVAQQLGISKLDDW